MAAAGQRRGLLIAVSVAQLVVTVGLSALGWGSVNGLLAHPARAAFVVLILVFTLVALLSPINLSSGRREVTESRWLFAPAAAGILLLTWLMPYMDRRDVWTIDGDTARYVGVVFLVAGGTLRVWPMFVLGQRFSGLVAIQPGHQLVTDGPYRYVRHPSYLGMALGLIGWALVFRSSVGLLAAALGFPLLLKRIAYEEGLLASQFGEAYTEYCQHTARLFPWVY
jgi:protein-S-isoprenylcysteine O-methyltransferase Ste14